MAAIIRLSIMALSMPFLLLPVGSRKGAENWVPLIAETNDDGFMTGWQAIGLVQCQIDGAAKNGYILQVIGLVR